MKIIGFFGQMGNGKTTVAYRTAMFLLGNYNVRFTVRGFATAVKQTVSDVFGISYREIDKWKLEGTNPPDWQVDMRTALQMVGDGLRQIKESVWIDKVLQDYTIIQDGRYYNEALAIKNAGGKNYLIIRPDKINDSTHPSESWCGALAKYALSSPVIPEHSPINPHYDATWKGLQLFDGIVMNDGDIYKLFDSSNHIADDIIQFLIGKKNHE